MITIDGLDEIQNLQDQLTALCKRLGDSIEVKLVEFVSNNPRIDALHWTQYTPYFNDGEPCVFSFNGLSVKIANCGDDEEHDEEHDEEYDEDPVYGGKPWAEFWGSSNLETYQRACNSDYHWETDFLTKEEWMEIANLASMMTFEVMEGVLLAAFGDHAEVSVTANGCTVEYCNHD